MKLDFTGQIVLITGATRGIGKQLADDFSKLGARLILTGTHSNEINRLNRNGTFPGKYYRADFTRTESLENFLKVIRRLRRIDVCVNNAGINRLNDLGETRIQDWEEMISVNLKAPFLITREVSRLMKRNCYGRIINIASIFGLVSRERRSIYSMTKSGLRGLTVASSNELARYHVLVNTVSPGFILTDLTRKNLSRSELAKLRAQIPARRLGTPEDISRVVLFLASSLNTYLTGQNLVVDGGFVNV